ncbi:glycosyltransferase family 4 protein [Staphylococcus sp. GDY8P94P]|uniref:glycosyltransferase family 4 protein n=1 Tax=Staphylococcus sp. GDY8P94P TaxID=2804144 RepID=UPI001AEC206B|nr:glycosyltransferase family 4 protein [Staphylococcus sp. GDY8P94P]
MKLIYLSSSTLFSKSANSLHVMKMANSFSKIVKKVELVVRDVNEQRNPYEFYQVEQNFIIKNRKVNKFKAFSSILYTIKNINDFKQDLKNKETVFYGRDIMTLFLIAFFSNNVYIELHSIPSSVIKKLILKIMFKNKLVNRIFVISDALKKDVCNVFNAEEKDVVVVHDGADIHDFSNNEDNKKIGYVGSINKGRGIELILKLAHIHQELEFNIIGGDFSDLKEKLEIKDVPSNVKLLGYLSQKEIEVFIKDFYILLAPYQEKVGVDKINSDTSRWMSPIKLFEYMSFGKAIIVSDINVLREVIINNYNGVFAKPNDVNDWSRKIELLLENKDFHHQLKSNSFDTLKDYYTWDKRAYNISEKIKIR